SFVDQHSPSSELHSFAQPTYAPDLVHRVVNSPGQALDRSTRSWMESRFHRDFSDVRIHHDARAAESARTLNAQAYTVGQNVVFDTSQYQPHTRAGRELLAHELAHSLQQHKTIPPSGALRMGETHEAAEREADASARRIVSGGSYRTFST